MSGNLASTLSRRGRGRPMDRYDRLPAELRKLRAATKDGIGIGRTAVTKQARAELDAFFAAIDVLTEVLGSSPSGRLYKALVEPKKAASAKAALDFFKWSFQNGQPLATQLDYVPLPASLVQQIEAYWAQNIK